MNLTSASTTPDGMDVPGLNKAVVGAGHHPHRAHRRRGLLGWLRRHPRAAGAAAVLLIAAAGWGVNLVRLEVSVEVYRSYWAEPRGEPGGLVYVALGDSAAQGIGASRPDRGYVGLLAERMRQRTRRPVQVVNLSVSGATIRDLLDTQLPALRQLRPDVITVAIGGNDVRSFDPARFSDDVDELTAALPAGTVIADVPYFMHGGWERTADKAARMLTAGALAHRLPVAPLHAALRDRGAEAMLTDFAADWFHPNDRGHRVWADALWSELIRLPALAVEPGGPSATHRIFTKTLPGPTTRHRYRSASMSSPSTR